MEWLSCSEENEGVSYGGNSSSSSASRIPRIGLFAVDCVHTMQGAVAITDPMNAGQRPSIMLVGYVSDEYYAAVADVLVEFRSGNGARLSTRSSASGAVLADLAPGGYEVCLNKPGFGSKRV